MSNRYLYKAKRKDNRECNGEWVEGSLVWSDDADDDYKAIIIPATGSNMFTREGASGDLGFEKWYRVDPSTICQCTGIPDKKGKRIFEKNIIRDERGSLGIVEYGVFDYYDIGFYIRWLSGSAEYYRNELGFWANKVDVIGNIFDNPELLEAVE